MTKVLIFIFVIIILLSDTFYGNVKTSIIKDIYGEYPNYSLFLKIEHPRDITNPERFITFKIEDKAVDNVTFTNITKTVGKSTGLICFPNYKKINKTLYDLQKSTAIYLLNRLPGNFTLALSTISDSIQQKTPFSGDYTNIKFVIEELTKSGKSTATEKIISKILDLIEKKCSDDQVPSIFLFITDWKIQDQLFFEKTMRRLERLKPILHLITIGKVNIPENSLRALNTATHTLSCTVSARNEIFENMKKMADFYKNIYLASFSVMSVPIEKPTNLIITGNHPEMKFELTTSNYIYPNTNLDDKNVTYLYLILIITAFTLILIYLLYRHFRKNKLLEDEFEHVIHDNMDLVEEVSSLQHNIKDLQEKLFSEKTVTESKKSESSVPNLERTVILDEKRDIHCFLRLEGNSDNSIITIDVFPAIIGKLDDCFVQLSEPTVSRHHAKIDYQNGEFILTDLDSTNGTFINGKRIHEIILKPADEIQFGRFKCKFELL